MNSNIVTRAPKLGEIPSVGVFLDSAQVKSAAVTSSGAKDLSVNSSLKLVDVGNMPYWFSGSCYYFWPEFGLRSTMLVLITLSRNVHITVQLRVLIRLTN